MSRWLTTRAYAAAIFFWLKVDHKTSSKLLALNKIHLAAIVRHCPIGLLAIPLNILSDVLCQSYVAEGELESSRHFPLYCSVLKTENEISRQAQL